MFAREEDAYFFGIIDSLKTWENDELEHFKLSWVTYTQIFVIWLQHLFLYFLFLRGKSIFIYLLDYVLRFL